MSQSRRTIEQLLRQGSLPISNTDKAAIHLEVYPTKHTWLAFFDKAALIIGAVALVLALVFFVAYNWQNMDKIGKFALVEGALVITIALYVALSFRKRYRLIRQLLLLIASVITGSLLALFGQVYQTGADTWQLFFAWALLISPWVLIARFPALWLLWLGLIHAVVILYSDIAAFLVTNYIYQDIFRIGVLATINFVAFNLWLVFFELKRQYNPSLSSIETFKITSQTKTAPQIKIPLQSKTSLHWSTYVVGLLSTYFITRLAIIYVINDASIVTSLLFLLIWAGWCGFIVWRFYKRAIDLLMLTYLCGSMIAVVMFWVSEFLLNDWEAGELLLLALLLIAMSSAAVVWLRKVARLQDAKAETQLIAQGGDYE